MLTSLAVKDDLHRMNFLTEWNSYVMVGNDDLLKRIILSDEAIFSFQQIKFSLFCNCKYSLVHEISYTRPQKLNHPVAFGRPMFHD